MNVRHVEKKQQQNEFPIESAITKRNLNALLRLITGLRTRNSYFEWVWSCFQQNNRTIHPQRRFP